MNMDIAHEHDSFKAHQAPAVNPTVDSLLAAIAKLPIPPTAKYVGTIMVTMRLIDSKALAEFTDIPLRSVQRAMMQVSASGVIGAMSATSGAPIASSAPPVAPEPAPRVHAPAQMESPSGISLSQEVVASSAGEIPGLNENTGYFVEMLAGWLAGPMSVPDHETSHKLLAGYVKAYSADAVKAGMIELETEIVQGRRPRDVGKAFSGFVRKSHERATAPSTVVVAVPDWQQAKAEKAATARRLREHLTAMEAQ
jgi:hypothetical protein